MIIQGKKSIKNYILSLKSLYIDYLTQGGKLWVEPVNFQMTMMSRLMANT